MLIRESISFIFRVYKRDNIKAKNTLDKMLLITLLQMMTNCRLIKISEHKRSHNTSIAFCGGGGSACSTSSQHSF
jgi:hypothetical protein